MAVCLRFSPASLQTCRFAISPLRETMSAVRLLAHPTSVSYHQPWLQAIEPALEKLDLTPLALLAPRHSYSPDFLQPAPRGPATTFADELDVVRSAEPAQVRRETRRCLVERFGQHAPPAAAPLMGNGADARDFCAELLEQCWSALVEPWWPQIRAVLEADITYRARVLADAGLAAALRDLHPRIHWSRSTLRIDVPATAERTTDGLTLLPGVFGWPGLGVTHDPPASPTVDYSARGIASLWTPQPTADSSTLARLLGERRAHILATLSEPASTTGLAARCQLPVSSISEHLAVLRAAQLITTCRTGRLLQHSRTPLGTALVNTKHSA